ncbi:PREDICTED: tether containing UBX domain for GLUT4-like [Priapulus caudatus]|uniref:Tether containing UBX domain for GLUT4-like n=1 Tax=Priapulus caudatus TaxID=37621 RepID=A0ABM1EI95_PRICU|nr:PREDICTED: tether containing UBX domain for GLUT4-like [Priapulus caudatus]
MTSVVVLCPNGRRVNVHVTPSTALLQLIGHGRKVLDTDTLFRFANLPNKAQLEMVSASHACARSDTAVTVALQLEDGQRLQADFKPTVSVWDILQHWEHENSGLHGSLCRRADDVAGTSLHPVCTYLQREIVGERSLQTTSLKSLGLTKGRALIRLVHRGVAASVMADIDREADARMQREAKLDERVKVTQRSSDGVQAENREGEEKRVEAKNREEANNTEEANNREAENREEAEKRVEAEKRREADARSVVPRTTQSFAASTTCEPLFSWEQQQPRYYFPDSMYIMKCVFRHGRKVLDTDTLFRFANLPNKAQLEMVSASHACARSDTAVTVALQLEDGQRLQADFKPTVSVWDILQHWEHENSGLHGSLCRRADDVAGTSLHPVCTYLQREIVGERSLQTTSLKSLGLTKGRALIRLVHRGVAASVMADIDREADARMQREAKLDERVKVTQRSSDGVQAENREGEEKRVEAKNREEANNTEEANNREAENREEAEKRVEAEKRREADARSVVPRTTQSFAASTTSEPLFSWEQQQGVSDLLTTARNFFASESRNVVPQPSFSQPVPQYTEFKFPEETKGQDLYVNELSESYRKQQANSQACDRETVVYRLDDVPASMKVGDLDPGDKFFEFTVEDVRKRMADLKHESVCVYKYVALRVNFCYHLCFTVGTLRKFVMQLLAEKDLPFYLYTAPPKVVLSDDAGLLLESGLAPAAVVHFGCEQQLDVYLSAEATESSSSMLAAEDVASKWLNAGDQRPADDDARASAALPSNQQPPQSAVSTATESAAQQGNSQSKRPNSRPGSGGMTPKWFKPGK